MGQLSQQKYCERPMVTAPPFWANFWLTPLRNRRQGPSLTPHRSATLTLESCIFSPKFISAMHCLKNPAESVQHIQSRRQHGPNMVMHRGHMEPFSMRRRVLQPLKFHYMFRDYPKAHELLTHILHPSPAPDRWSQGAPGNVLLRWYGIVQVSLTGTTGSLPRIL